MAEGEEWRTGIQLSILSSFPDSLRFYVVSLYCKVCVLFCLLSHLRVLPLLPVSFCRRLGWEIYFRYLQQLSSVGKECGWVLWIPVGFKRKLFCVRDGR